MKKWIFLIIFVLVFITGSVVVYAGVRVINGEYIKFYYTEVEETDDAYFVDCHVEFTYSLFHPSYSPSIVVKKGYENFFAYTIENPHQLPERELEEPDDNGNTYEYYLNVTIKIPKTLPDGTDFTNYDGIYFRFFSLNNDGTTETHMDLEADLVTPDPTKTPTPTPTTAPDPTATPEPTATTAPTATPEPSPTNTPKPTPTNTPTPTPSPTPAPILRLNAYVDGNKAVAEYYTGGCTPVKSSIEYYEVDVLTDSLMKIDGETFLSGEGSRTDSMVAGKTYRYKLTYTYRRSGVQYTEEIWSGDLMIIDQELEDYRSTGQINNYRTLILYIWENLMELKIPIEGFNIKIRTLFIWIMIASLGVFFFKKWNGG